MEIVQKPQATAEAKAPRLITEPLSDRVLKTLKGPKGTYQLIEEKSKTPNSILYKAWHVGEGKYVAVKQVTVHSDVNEKLAKKEYEIGKNFDHPNVVKYVDCFYDEIGDQYVVTEWIQGKNLKSYRAPDEVLPAEVIKSIASGILDGLDHIHNLGAVAVVHRDLNPNNVVITEEGRPVIVDFGAAVIDVKIGFTTSYVVVTPGYTAPEVAAGWEGLVCPASDLFSVGGLISFMICGMSAGEILEKGLPKGVNKFNEVIEKAVQLKAADRFGSAKEMKDALRNGVVKVEAAVVKGGSKEVTQDQEIWFTDEIIGIDKPWFGRRIWNYLVNYDKKYKAVKQAVETRDIEHLKKLLRISELTRDHKADIFKIAYDRGDLEVAEILMRHGFDPEKIYMDYKSISYKEQVRVQTGEITVSENVSIEDKLKETLLINACVTGRKKFVELFLKYGANPNGIPTKVTRLENNSRGLFVGSGLDANKISLRPLHAAIARTFVGERTEDEVLELVKLLVSYGADPKLGQSDLEQVGGKKPVKKITSALQEAEKIDYSKVAAYLKEKGALW